MPRGKLLVTGCQVPFYIHHANLATESVNSLIVSRQKFLVSYEKETISLYKILRIYEIGPIEPKLCHFQYTHRFLGFPPNRTKKPADLQQPRVRLHAKVVIGAYVSTHSVLPSGNP